MHSFPRHRHQEAGSVPVQDTKGLVLNNGWRYDFVEWFHNTFSFHGTFRKLRQTTINLAKLQPGEQVLDVGCGTGTLAMEVAHRVGNTGCITGIDPGEQQIARARAKSEKFHLPAEFQIGVIENLAFPEQTFNVVFSTLMMHHLPSPIKRKGLAEIYRVLKPEGRLVIADFKHKQERAGKSTRFHAGGSRVQELNALIKEVGFTRMETEVLQPARFSGFPGAIIICAYKI